MGSLSAPFSNKGPISSAYVTLFGFGDELSLNLLSSCKYLTEYWLTDLNSFGSTAGSGCLLGGRLGDGGNLYDLGFLFVTI